MRYFVRVNNQNQPVALYRLDLDTPKTISEQLWLNGSWAPSERIVEVLTQGSSDYDEITLEIAKQIFPEAFEELAKSIGSYEVSKAEGDKRYTLGAMYIPDRLDAHNEWTDAEELQRAVWDYVRSNDRRIRLQHNRETIAGEWVEVMSFPYELTVPITTPSGIMVNHTYPANTVFLGVIWEEWAWEKIQNGEILGYSIGGRAERLYVDMEPVEKDDGPTVNSVHVDTIMNPKKKKPKETK
jgi:hypothetical protein